MKLNIFDHDGTERQLDVSVPTSLMEAIRDGDLPIAAECGGNRACATCHVYVDERWIGQLPERTAEESDMLELAVDPLPVSRLSCQIMLTEMLDGLAVRLAPGSER